MIGIGNVGKGRNSRIHAIEIYDRERFIIMTGDRSNNLGITADQPFVDYMLELLGPVADAEAQYFPPSQPSDEKDEDLVARIEAMENGPKFSALFSGNVRLNNGKDGDGHLCALLDALSYPSQSEADLALIEMLCFSTADDEQVVRLFLASPLGRREKALRRDYVRRSIRSARSLIANNKVSPVSFSGQLARSRSGDTAKQGSAGRPETRAGLILTRVSDVKAREIKWIWPGLAPTGAVIMLSCEDDIADTIRPRLDAAGADVTKVEVVEGVYSQRGERRIFHVKKDMPHLEEALNRVEGVKLVVIDPITAYLDGEDSHKTSDVRSALAPLQDLAMQWDIAVVVVSHLNKSGGQGRAVNAVTGSGAFVALARGAFLVEQDADDPERRLFLLIKNNLTHAPGLAFCVRERELPNGIRAPFVEFEVGTVDITADEALSRHNVSDRGGGALDDARRFLIDQLRDSPAPAKEMEERAKEEGVSGKTLRRAREELSVITRKETGRNGGWIWSLPLDDMKSNMP